MIRSYEISKISNDNILKNSEKTISSIPSTYISDYKWIRNNYKPKVEIKLGYNEKFLFAYFKSYEKIIKASYTNINDPVYKDSCVELFINLFPNETESYFNFEMNPLGTLLVGFGHKYNRMNLPVEMIEKIMITSNIKKRIIGKHGLDYWSVKLLIPFILFENSYHKKFQADNARGNFFKCGDETYFKHFGVWNNIDYQEPNFHLPEYFGNLIFC